MPPSEASKLSRSSHRLAVRSSLCCFVSAVSSSCSPPLHLVVVANIPMTLVSCTLMLLLIVILVLIALSKPLLTRPDDKQLLLTLVLQTLLE